MHRRKLGLLLQNRAPQQPVREDLLPELAVLLALGCARGLSRKRRRLEAFELRPQLGNLVVQRRDLFLYSTYGES